MNTSIRNTVIAGLMTIPSTLIAGTVTTDGADLVIKTKGGFEAKTTDGQHSFALGGRIQWDYNQAQLNGETDEDDLAIRRARIFVKGTVAKDWAYKAQFNIGNGNGGEPEDLYIRYKGFGKAAQVTVGRQKVAFGLEEMTSSKDITALERSGITEQYAIGRNDAITLHGKQGLINYSVSAFEDGDAASDNDFALAGRVTLTPYVKDQTLIHVGAGYADRADDRKTANIELAANIGSVSLQTEYFDEEQGADDRDGYYAQVGWVITGESRPYKDGKFKRIKPASENGAWEVFARYEDGNGNHSDIELGRVDANAYSVGVNWYANSNIRIGMNYSEGESQEVGSSDEGEEFRMRLQLTF